MAKAQRQRRVADQIQRELAGIIRLELKDPRVGMITLTDVEVSSDFAHAKVFFTTLGGEDARVLAEAGLSRASGFLRSMLGKTLKIHNTPELHFIFDTSVESGMRISQLIDEALAPPSKPKVRRRPAKRA